MSWQRLQAFPCLNIPNAHTLIKLQKKNQDWQNPPHYSVVGHCFTSVQHHAVEHNREEVKYALLFSIFQ